ncbi:2-keto-3-deoxygluconate kinase [Paenarthrobacter nitroguajacolicus]|uniref:sugar kinase n=1 Tax=Paenarthrobacter nitroguajacolicus TaxID=211146 RepID=UPI0015B92E1D|nr:sugar kinase [Paenarthrobacter nitroguajacolicus]NWL10333.1 2-keto-3-deoxygluconate kinase [Paenarthrobacter nitroguajacolicus]
MAETLDILAVGETMVMVSPTGGGRLDGSSTFVLQPGGAESNVAAHLGRLGHKAGWASILGEDPLGDLILDSLTADGVDIRNVARDARHPTAVYFKDPTVVSTSVYYYRSGSAASHMSVDDLSRWVASTPKLVHLSGITPALSESCLRLSKAIVHDRPFGKALISFDINHRERLWNGDAATELLALARASDIVFVGRDEAENVWGTKDAESIKELIPEPSYLIVKDGSHEAVSFTPSGVFREPARAVDVVDVVGAGDGFAAGWLSGLMHDRSEPVRLRMGHGVASRVVQSPTDSADLPPAAQLAQEASNLTAPLRT